MIQFYMLEFSYHNSSCLKSKTEDLYEFDLWFAVGFLKTKTTTRSRSSERITYSRVHLLLLNDGKVISRGRML